MPLYSVNWGGTLGEFDSAEFFFLVNRNLAEETMVTMARPEGPDNLEAYQWRYEI